MTTVLVTGAGGYIGQRLVRHLAALDGVTVRALVRNPVPWDVGVDEVVGDLALDPGLARRAASGADVAVHLAGANEVAAARDPEGTLAATVLAAEHMAASGVPRLIYLSTVHVYGAALQEGAMVDEDTPAKPEHPYAAARLACEDAIRRSGITALIFRLTNGVGAPARPDVPRWSLVANDLCREGACSGRLTLRTSGMQWRDFIGLSDVDTAIATLIHRPFGSDLCNLGSGVPVTVRALAELVQEAFVAAGAPRPTLIAPPVPAHVPGPYTVDVGRLAGLGLAVRTPLRSAVDETVRFCLDHQSELQAASDAVS